MFAHIAKQQQTKMDFKVVNCVLIGWDENTKGYQCYNPSSNKVFITQHVKVDESEMPHSNNTIGESVSTSNLKWTVHSTFFYFAITTSIDLLPKGSIQLHVDGSVSQIQNPSP